MRQALAKSIRRDLRRSIGVDAIETIQSTGLTLNALRLDFVELTRAYAVVKQEQAAEIAALRDQLEAVQTCLIEQTNRLTRLERRGFWARVINR